MAGRRASGKALTNAEIQARHRQRQRQAAKDALHREAVLAFLIQQFLDKPSPKHAKLLERYLSAAPDTVKNYIAHNRSDWLAGIAAWNEPQRGSECR
jgi:hypothetical protein